MRWLPLVALAAASVELSAARIARADPPPKPDPDLFGPARSTPPKPDPDLFGDQAPAAPPACDDGHDFGCATATNPLVALAPYALSQWLPAKYLLRLPVADVTHDQVAGFALGAGRDEAGPTFGGATGLENRWSINGAPTDDLRTGGTGTRVPLIFLDGIRVQAGGFSARDRTSTGGTIDAQLIGGSDHHEIETYAWLSYNATGRRRPIADNSYTIRTIATTPGPDLTVAAVARGPLGHVLGGTAWYAAGIAPNIGTTGFDWHAASLVDANGDGVPDGSPGQLTTLPIEDDHRAVTSYFVPMMARLGLDRGVHHIDVSVVGDAAGSTRFLGNSTIQAAGLDRTDVVGDAIATWRAEWTDTHARVQLAWHRSYHNEHAHDAAAANIPQLISLYVPVPLVDDPALSAACDDLGVDPFPNIPNCPVPNGFFASGGAGLLTKQIGDRPSITADIAHRIGRNTLRAGVTAEDTLFETTSRYTGGELDASLFPGHLIQTRFIGDPSTCGADPAAPCRYIDQSVVDYRTLYSAAYVEDTWHAAPDIDVDGGLRWEMMWVGTALHFSNQLSPRLGLAWDPLGGGRSRVWVSMGRSYVLLPTGIGATIIGGDNTVDDTTLPQGRGRDIFLGNPTLVVPGIKPMTQDELTAGGELAIQRAVRLTGWVQGRWLARGLDTTENGLDNPGRSESLPAQRSSVIITGEIATTPASSLVLRIGYTYGYTVGSSTGAFDPRQGAVLYAGNDYNLTDVNQFGRLPTDDGHRVYAEVDRRGKLAGIAVDAAMRLTVASGKPRNVLANTDIGIVELIPRGCAGRWPMTSQANVRLGAHWRGLDVTLDVFNLFDRQQAQTFDEVYTNSFVEPILGGSAEDLVFLKDNTGRPAIVRKGYNLPVSFQSPPSIVLGVHHAF